MSDYIREAREKRKNGQIIFRDVSIDYILDQADALKARAEKAEVEAERYQSALKEIDDWAKAYPLDVFPEPDFAKVRELLEAGGISLGSVTASNMRHVITEVAHITGAALAAREGKDKTE